MRCLRPVRAGVGATTVEDACAETTWDQPIASGGWADIGICTSGRVAVHCEIRTAPMIVRKGDQPRARPEKCHRLKAGCIHCGTCADAGLCFAGLVDCRPGDKHNPHTSAVDAARFVDDNFSGRPRALITLAEIHRRSADFAVTARTGTCKIPNVGPASRCNRLIPSWVSAQASSTVVAPTHSDWSISSASVASLSPLPKGSPNSAVFCQSRPLLFGQRS